MANDIVKSSGNIADVVHQSHCSVGHLREQYIKYISIVWLLGCFGDYVD